MLNRIIWSLIALLAAVSVYGFVSERLWAQHLWSDTGAARFLAYTAVYWAIAGVLAWRWPGWFPAAAAGFAVAYSAWWAGVAAPLAVVYFLGSCWALGRWIVPDRGAVIATLAGAAVWMSLIWAALHFPVNTPWVYGVAFALPYGGLIQGSPRMALRWRGSRREALAIALLVYVVMAHWLAALKPDVSADGLSMHLALPAAVAWQGQWTFDFQHTAWALMPAGADALYTGVYLLGGEASARLLNVAFLAMIAVLIGQAGRRWVSPALSWLVAALFVSTPLAQLVTGTLFVENVWAAFLLGAVVLLLDEDLRTAALLAGAAMAVKLISAAFIVPLLGWMAWVTWQKRAWRRGALAAAVFVALAAPTYIYAWARSGNPVFPFANALFRSPGYPSDQSFSDARYDNLRPTWTTPYDLMFHSSRYIEGQEGAAGFQYLLLAVPALFLAWRRDRLGIAAVALAGTVVILFATPNLRYLYAAMPLASLAIAWVVVESPRVLGAAVVAIVGLNVWFLPASGWYHTDFALFRKSEIAPYLIRVAPTRVLIDRLNREAPGEAVAFFTLTDTTAGLRAKAYTATWHHERWWAQVRNSADAAAVAAYLTDLGIERVVAPVSRQAPFEVVQKFLERWLDPDGEPVGELQLFRLRETATVDPNEVGPLPPGRHDEMDPRIEYTGAWLHDPQWAEAANQTVTYSDQPGDTVRFTFTGSAITYIYTRAFNRGVAEVWIDGRLRRRVDQRSENTQWQQTTRFAGLGPGEHSFELRVGMGGFADLDAVEIEP